MSGKASVHQQAETDIDDIAAYIARDNLPAALRFYTAVERAIASLADMPRMGALYGFADAEWADVRFWPIRGFRNYLIFYRPLAGGVEILRVLHGARDTTRSTGHPNH